ncbi:MAG: RNA polymerase sigma factor [Candidatus Kapaibacterium sp.]
MPIRHRLVQFSRALTDDEEEARDLVGDVVLVALQAFPKLQDEEAFLSWLFTIATRLQRRRRSRGRRFQRYDTTVHPDTLPTPAYDQEVRADIEALRRAIAQLPEKQKEVVVLFEISGLSLQEICEIQGGSLSGVKMRLVRGRKRLAELLGVEVNRELSVTAETTHYQKNGQQTSIQIA